MKEYTFAEFCELPMTLSMHISGSKEHYLHRFQRETNVNKVVITKVDKYGRLGKSSTIYYLPEDSRSFNSIDQVYVAYMEKVCGVSSC